MSVVPGAEPARSASATSTSAATTASTTATPPTTPTTPTASKDTRAARGRADRTGPRGASVLDHLRDAPVAIVGSLLVFGGAVLQLIAIVSVSWWHVTLKTRSVTYGFADFGDRTQQGLAYIYFSWGAWVLLFGSLALGVAACVRWRGSRPFRIAGGLFGVIGAGLTIGALLTFAFQADEDIFQVARNYTSGVYLAMLGLLATAFGAAAGGAGGR